MNTITSPIADLCNELERRTGGVVRTDVATRWLYSTDASIYQIEPLGVFFPASLDDLNAAVEICAKYKTPALARGSGSSLAGQAIGRALIVDCSRHLNGCLSIDPEEQTAWVEPGLILNDLNRAAVRLGLQFGPDPASAERATLAGSIANNATGAHSILYGMAADHLLEAEVVLSDGSQAHWGAITEGEARRLANPKGERGLASAIYRQALEVRQRHSTTIQDRWPQTWRRASGYSLNYLLPWSPTHPPQWHSANGDHGYPPGKAGELNLAPLLAGSEGTLAVIRKAKLRLVKKPKLTILGLLAFESIVDACRATPQLLELQPAAIELIPRSITDLARGVPAYAGWASLFPPAEAVLVVEFAGDSSTELRQRAGLLGGQAQLVEDAAAQSQIWAVRKVGLGIMQSRPGDIKPVSFIEDLSVPVERLAGFISEIERILAAHGTSGEIYAHASAGCLHIRPLVNLKQLQGVQAMRAIAEQAARVTIALGGSVSGEHGDGLARSEWLTEQFGEEVVRLFRDFKHAADPFNLLNPGKIVASEPGAHVQKMDENLRYGPAYFPQAWLPAMDFSRQGGLAGAIEQCNGAGVCRKSGGLMCPSFQATHSEMHSPRGRANLLRALISGQFQAEALAETAVYEALDLCLACKGCKAECPSAVDIAKLRYEFWDHYYRTHRRRVRDHIFGYISMLARVGHPFGGLINLMLGSSWVRRLAAPKFGITDRRGLPRFARRSCSQQISRLQLPGDAGGVREQNSEKALLLLDAFTEYFYPQAGVAAYRALLAAGCQVQVLRTLGAGRTLISKGFLGAAKDHARRLVAEIRRLDPRGEAAIVGVEPSEILSMRDEYKDLIAGEQPGEYAKKAWMIDEYLVRPDRVGEARIVRIANTTKPKSKTIILHGHCYQKSLPPADDLYPVGASATRAMLEAVGYTVQLVEAGCCGMAGAFGYESEHFDLSIQVGELALLPAVRAVSADAVIAASGVSCQAQIEDGAGRKAVHPITLLFDG